MRFQALTGAPILREGVTLNIMAVPQTRDAAPARLSAGSQVTLRFGHCCPRLAEGHIVSLSPEPERAVLQAEGADWTLEPTADGVDIPGIVSQTWIVREPVQAPADAIGEPAETN